MKRKIVTMSSMTSFVALGLILLSYGVPFFQKQLWMMGIFSLSGALTNWLAVHMLFERVPGLYGSGVIVLHFEGFKGGIRNLLVKQFFSQENIQRLLAEEGALWT